MKYNIYRSPYIASRHGSAGLSLLRHIFNGVNLHALIQHLDAYNKAELGKNGVVGVYKNKIKEDKERSIECHVKQRVVFVLFLMDVKVTNDENKDNNNSCNYEITFSFFFYSFFIVLFLLL